jgi:dTMP kinase
MSNNNKRNRFILFEGVDGAGKSIVSEEVSKSLCSTFIESPTDQFGDVRKYVNSHTPMMGQFLFYMATNLDLSNTVKEKLEDNNVVCARYYFSSIVDYSARLGITPEEMMDKLPVTDNDFIQPDLTILLYVNETEQRNRINGRNNGVNTHSDELCLNNQEYRRKITDGYLGLAEKKNWKVIDTSDIGIEEVVSRSIQCIGELK